MAIVKDADLGTNQADSNSTTIVLTTAAAVASGGFIVLGVSWFDSGITLTGVAGGGLTWVIDKQGVPASSSDSTAVVSAQAPSGLASSTAITATFSGSVGARTIGGTSFTGVKTSSALDTTANATGATQAGWATGSMTVQAGSLLFGVCFTEGTASGSTPVSPSVEAWEDVDATNGYGVAANYRIEASAGSYAVEGTWGASAKWGNVGAAYLAAPSGQMLRPDADVTTTGWATAPLWSKIEESSPDGTVITATAS